MARGKVCRLADRRAGRTIPNVAGLEKDALLLVSILLVKDGRNHSGPADFVSDVALTFQTLEDRARQDDYFESSPATAALTVSGSRSCRVLGFPSADRPVAG